MNEINKIEALLFVAGDEGMSLNELAYLSGQSTSAAFDAVERLKQKYAADGDSALHILEVGDRFLMTTKKEFSDLLKAYATSSMSKQLSQAALECLSIIAYKQPITRVEVDHIRGVQSSGAIQKLVLRQLIEEKGRVDGPGRAILYGTTAYFYDYFGIKTIDDLPSIEDIETQVGDDIPTDLFFDKFNQQFEDEYTEDLGD
ncbi:SMC-Scp complex subunit ScpB [Vagococcus acidifermentans]|uniref:Segregation and condensation protein B n=1 Tax=Vagococcus acidifermentans TaxID=564710 RepID=A0A430AN10_9ENTE|nr:SMC-Scp complex subunit ScpB [Vagococcus acidifermentans]RSU09501.1 SMC-Scp complex subunit ScpB [Vagococcus acidifermentans]